MHAAALRGVPTMRGAALARLAYSSLLLPSLWSLLRRLSPRDGGALGRLLAAAPDPGREPLTPLLLLLAEGAAHLLPVLDEREVFSERRPFGPDELAHLATFLNALAFRLFWDAPISAGAVVAAADGGGARELRDASVRLLGLLHERDGRRSFCADGAWLAPGVAPPRLRSDFNSNVPRARALVASCPWMLPFELRVEVFRELIVRERDALPGEAAPEHLRGHRVKIRREHLLEDGYVQLAALPADAMKGTVRVEFVSGLGLAEAGIDRTGVFKEFLEDVLKRAFDVDRGLFALTPQQRLCPSAASELADPNHLRLFEFVGRMLGKAVYEGIVIELPLADFFVAKLLGRYPGFDLLPSLDAQLHASLEQVKVYDGDVENDLCLSFSVEEEQFGARSTVELRDGGAAIPVTADNRIEYVHLVADYHLNKKLAPQAKAFVAGLHAVVPPGWLRLFSAPELQRLVNGDDAPVDVGDLRKHTRYAAGYNAMSPTVRDLWAVVGEMGRDDRALFLKFVTSCSRPPLLGFAHLAPPFTIQCVSSDGEGEPTSAVMAFFGVGRKETGRLPTASTCFNLLKLPNFKSKKVLREKLLYAIRSGAGFELS